MLAADIVVAAQDCRFAQLEVKRNLMPTGGATIRITERAGRCEIVDVGDSAAPQQVQGDA